MFSRFKLLLRSEEELAQLHIPAAERGDTGKFAITATNAYGEETGIISVIVLGKSSQQRGPHLIHSEDHL